MKKKQENGFTGIYAVLLIAAILLAFVAFGAGYWLSGGGEVYYIPTEQEDEVVVEDETDEEFVEMTEPEISESQGELSINWLSEPRETDPQAIVMATLMSETTGEVKAYELGTVASGDYQGMTLTVQIVTYLGMGDYYKSHYLLISEDEGVKPVLLDKYAIDGTSFFRLWSEFGSFLVRQSDGMQSWSEDDLSKYSQFVQEVVFDTESTIPEFEYEDMATDSLGNSYKLLGPSNLAVYPIEIDISSFSVVSSMNGSSLYQVLGDEGQMASLKNLFINVDDGGRVVIYDSYIPFWDYEDMSFQNELKVVGDTTVTGTYTKALGGGCGWTSITNVVDEAQISPLSWLGYITDGGVKYDIYEPQNYSMEIYLDDYNTWLNWHEGGSLPDFLAVHPFLYYQDELGRWIQFSNIDVLPQAECGKPVIYLYPEVETQIDVTLDLAGGFSYTEPAYENGWSVIASPDGTLVNIKDGQVYPYLFWEGKGGMYQAPENYWVVAQPNVERFLVKTLGKMGLNRQETADFMEFWYPRMQDAAYYQIGFHGTEVMNVLAPMTLSQQPDSVLRILMDFQELNAPAPSNPGTIVPFNRTGFSVVEWGGVIQ
ncbi:MAG: hypothetical protein ACD_66C00021G0001 [uncultured bacterium]|uniref:Uncharacterized protein n=1 Tax=Candidatus Uhrbacteria bacterium GW2011_GWC1_41_20 TaxID=1618983 RepID=A0A0G0VG91_9BACT|nr:MAG: hypothetical protein ACD_66C00021G0001 [uncultured bacterium]KKR23259.1 MAG: hypothetical protein UT52_C0001G0053 [Candidatus Uhrbacteria bacterium GW2011_GWE1_39_46]KKR64441.1 MAG: hypothetical protein UU04_C0002G0053 [Candidatus Uhrbacteria bacterium GW2011_GWC2_40_450]KKR90679.1 MAG: hypothetical protein UU40_C0001G0016 [Candidatus Uhrbacteria bacterium GW2011_GWD2_41_121]KKR96603.1 MAG: hypothetical protein UU46_C0001G0053 [Candidatus Uhrbacteria bacterium GW2011_GWD1_41_16]KKR9999